MELENNTSEDIGVLQHQEALFSMANIAPSSAPLPPLPVPLEAPSTGPSGPLLSLAGPQSQSAGPSPQPGLGPPPAFLGPPPVQPLQHFNAQVAPPAAIITQAVMLPEFSGEPQKMLCPYCKSEVRTLVKYNTGCLTHVAGGCLFCCGCFLCSCIPYLVDACKDAEHNCPSCGRFLGHYRRIG